MILSSFIASIHYLMFALAFACVVLRGHFFSKLIQTKENPEVLKSLFFADNCWGLSVCFLIGSGIYRAFGGLEKGTTYYMQSHVFWLKMSMVVLILLLESIPMTYLIRWRIATAKKKEIETFLVLPTLRKINHLEILFMALIPFAASLMARGIDFL